MLNLNDDGVLIKKGFLERQKLEPLTKEVNDFFDSTSSGVPLGVIIQSRSRSQYKYSISSPTLSIFSVNLLELSIDVLDLIKGNYDQSFDGDWLLTNVCIERDTTDDLFWHTDHRSGMLRAFLYLEGGGDDSGAFKYMKGSHKRDFYVEHRLSQQKIEELDSSIYICSGGAGDIVIADTNGFHANCVKKKRRTVILFEFQPQSMEAPRSSIPMLGSSITEKVLRNIALFKAESKGFHGINARMTSVPNTLSPYGIIAPQLRYLIKRLVNYKQK